MKIINSKIEDIDAIFRLYDAAIVYQKEVFNKQWEGFERELIETEIGENRQWKIIIEDRIACIFATTEHDVLFWKEKDIDPAIYIHRIVTNPDFRGTKFVNIIIAWATEYCKTSQKTHIRIDTWGDNERLITYYEKCGFHHVETINLDKTDGLPAHYKGSLALLEINVM